MATDLPRPGSAYEAARLRWAQLSDAAELCGLYAVARPETHEDTANMAEWLEHGGALLLESSGEAGEPGAGELLCALRWREEEGGWRVDRIATRPEARGQGFGRWLMTKVEALAIRYNVPQLTLTLDRPDLLGYYRRLGYRQVAEEAAEGAPDEETLTLCKRVGGTWQVQERAFS